MPAAMRPPAVDTENLILISKSSQCSCSQRAPPRFRGAPDTAFRPGTCPTEETRHGRLQPWRAAAASVIGTTIEYYDFFIYATAAATFKKVFFPALGGLAGTRCRPVDLRSAFLRSARSAAWCLDTRGPDGPQTRAGPHPGADGSATLLIGLLPDPHIRDRGGGAGAADPARVAQGFAMGGELGGAVLMTMERPRAAPRVFWQLASAARCSVWCPLPLPSCRSRPCLEEAFLAWAGGSRSGSPSC
ncbi:MHS family MFS transporter [Pseudonocardia sp. MCCB 268]|nr:MHS family MFS transporter [Pseudonocardia cytotoxica]